MSIFATLQSYLRELLIFHWTDLIEISLIASAIYYFCTWLRRDAQHNLAPQFLALCGLLVGADYLGLQNLSTLLLSCWPLLLLLFIIVHSDTLQKNFVAYKKIVPAKIAPTGSWVESLVAACLLSPQKNHSIMCVLEGQDRLEDFLTPGLMIKATATKPLLEALLSSPAFNAQQLVWLTQTGQLYALNASWQAHLSSDTAANCLRLSQKTDLIFFTIDQKQHQFNLIAAGKISQNLHTNDIIKVIQQQIRKNQAALTEPGANRDPQIITHPTNSSNPDL